MAHPFKKHHAKSHKLFLKATRQNDKAAARNKRYQIAQPRMICISSVDGKRVMRHPRFYEDILIKIKRKPFVPTAELIQLSWKGL